MKYDPLFGSICLLFTSIYFFSGLIRSFSFFTPSKRTQNWFTIIRYILDVLFIPFIYIYSYLHFLTLREKCPNTEFFLARIFPYLDRIERFTPWISVFSRNTGKYGPEKTPYLNTFHAVLSTLTCLYLFTLTYPNKFSLYYYTNLIKLIKYGKYRNYDEIF